MISVLFGMTAEEITDLWAGLAIFLLLVYMLNKFALFREVLDRKRLNLPEKIFFIFIFSLIGIGGAYWHIVTPGGLINFRAVGPVIGGFLGGSFVGVFVGAIVGLYRVLFFHTPLNEIHGVITLLQGLTAGILSAWIKSHQRVWATTLILGVFIEIGSSIIYSLAVYIDDFSVFQFSQLIFPNILTNSIAISLFMGVLADSLNLGKRIEYATAKSTFRSFNLVLSSIASGLTPEIRQRLLYIIGTALPELESIQLLPIREEVERKENAGHIYRAEIKGPDSGGLVLLACKKSSFPFSHFELEFLDGIKRMLETIDEFERLRQSDHLRAEAEIRMLQAQINPHFLFNTLNTISYYCTFDTDTAMDLIARLSDYYRYSLKNPSSFVFVEEEMDTIKAFMDLQQARFSDRFRIVYRYDRSSRLKIPPLILQPIAENALAHGILPKKEGGIIRIGIQERETDCLFYVYDNGVGMDKEQLAHLFDRIEDRTSIGLTNVQQRLLNIYGPFSGLHITSRKGKGTLVSFRIKKERSIDE